MLEGGYDLDALSNSSATVLREMPPPAPATVAAPEASPLFPWSRP